MPWLTIRGCAERLVEAEEAIRRARLEAEGIDPGDAPGENAGEENAAMRRARELRDRARQEAAKGR